MISYKGKLGVLVALPIFGQILGALDLSALAGEVAALAAATVTFTPPSVFGIVSVIAAITTALNAGFQPPAFDFKGNLLIKLGLLKAKYELLLKISTLLAQGSVRLYEYDGAAGTFGAELGATLSGADVDGGIAPTQSTFAVLLVAEGGSAGETTLKLLRSGV
jgi:hypothetical protein